MKTTCKEHTEYGRHKSDSQCPYAENETAPQHTPTPFRFVPETIHGKDRYKAVYIPKWVAEALEGKDHAFIFRAVNFHQVLLNIAKNLEYKRHGKTDSACEVCETIANAEGIPHTCDPVVCEHGETFECHKCCEQAIAKAEGK